MVQNLNILSFAPYGKLLAERSDSAGLPQGEQWEERLLAATTQETYQYLPTEPVYLDYETGMSILAVAKGREEFSIFTWISRCVLIPACALRWRRISPAAPCA